MLGIIVTLLRRLSAAPDAAGALALGLALAAWLGAALPAADMVNALAPVWCAGSAAAAAVLRLLRPRASDAIRACIAASAMHGALIVPEAFAALAPKEASPPAQASVRVVTLNVWDLNPDPSRAAAYLAESDADFVILQEMGDDTLAALAPLRARYPYWTRCASWPYCRLTILSRTPPRDEGRETPTGMFGVRAHRHYPLLTRLVAATYTLEGGAAVRIIGVHARRPPPLFAQARDARFLLRELRRFPRTHTIVAGDFNLTPWSFGLRRLDAESGLRRHTRALATWPVPVAALPIDHVYAGAAFAALDVRAGPDVGSDHRPIEARFALR